MENDIKKANKFFAAYMRREGPKNPGSKRIPIGPKNCLLGLKFLITGVMDSLDRDECANLINKYGGNLISGVTKKVSNRRHYLYINKYDTFSLWLNCL